MAQVKFIEFLKDIKIEHTLFALPFAITSMFMAIDSLPEIKLFFWIILAMVGARSWAMAFNRIVDAEYDRKNERTKNRAIPAGRLSKKQMFFYAFIALLIFEISAYEINHLAFLLSPLAIFIISFYSFTKRFSYFSHFFLGLSLAIAPVGAWVAVKEEISLISILLGCAVLFWTAGFDILYSLQDIEFDKKEGLYSFPVKFGIEKSLLTARIMHAIMILFLIILSYPAALGRFYILGIVLCGIFIAYEHFIVKPSDLSRINQAFFTVNAVVSVAIMIFTIADIFLR
ncbi:MAG: 4-hydroxybenzoate octaprenyltransferase [Candidatus Schekmanbacteria bacterium]|nr:MAG: 4-hydroxybenzoate octaprenyltransferase [Candidatus Schekmanbacteria bacterium]